MRRGKYARRRSKTFSTACIEAVLACGRWSSTIELYFRVLRAACVFARCVDHIHRHCAAMHATDSNAIICCVRNLC
ncbi:hypothetical protein [Lysobacter gummosus]|uniref:hypothetical protein n=1 Tax=Lysobacter gummosus TaxID=262324 RepID=UPI003626D8CF